MNERILRRLQDRRVVVVSAVVAILATCAFVLTLATTGLQTADAESGTMTGQFDGSQQIAINRAIEARGFQQSEASEQATSPDDCQATIYYYEYTNYEDPDAVMVEPGLRLLGTHTLTGLTEGQQLNAWDYVADIPGHFFFDGWPFTLTITTNPEENTFEFFYFKLYNYEYTVNYYLMTGADLQADNWTDALAPEDVTFEKLGSEIFTDQRYDMLVEGDAYEYKLDGMYVIDTYPAQIRLGADTDNNVINVLYTPTSSTLPDRFEVSEIDEILPPDADDAAGDGAAGDGAGDDSVEGTLPDDEIFDRDEIIDLIPGAGGNNTITGDFVGGENGPILITDEMLANPVPESQVETMVNVYQTGRNDASMPRTSDEVGNMAWVFGGIAVAAAAVMAVALFARSRSSKQSNQ